MKRKGNKSKGNECLKSGKGKENEEKGREEARSKKQGKQILREKRRRAFKGMIQRESKQGERRGEERRALQELEIIDWWDRNSCF